MEKEGKSSMKSKCHDLRAHYLRSRSQIRSEQAQVRTLSRGVGRLSSVNTSQRLLAGMEKSLLIAPSWSLLMTTTLSVVRRKIHSGMARIGSLIPPSFLL